MDNKSITIIGAGPSGLFMAFQAGMLGIKSNIVDSLAFVGGQCVALYPEKPIYDIPAFKSILAKDLIKNLMEQIAPFSPNFLLNQKVIGCEKRGSSFLLKTDSGTEILSDAVVIAAGGGMFGPNKPPLSNIEQYEEKSVLYYIKDVSVFAGKNVIIAGGGDSAIDWANVLCHQTAKVFLVHRREKFKCAPDSERKFRENIDLGLIELLAPYQLHSLNGVDGNLFSVEIIDFDNQIRYVQADYLLPFYGLTSDLGPLKHWGLAMENENILVDPSSSMTSFEGIYAIGDISSYKSKLKLILTSFSEAAFAAHDIYRKLNNKPSQNIEYSTVRGIKPL